MNPIESPFDLSKRSKETVGAETSPAHYSDSARRRRPTTASRPACPTTGPSSSPVGGVQREARLQADQRSGKELPEDVNRTPSRPSSLDWGAHGTPTQRQNRPTILSAVSRPILKVSYLILFVVCCTLCVCVFASFRHSSLLSLRWLRLGSRVLKSSARGLYVRRCHEWGRLCYQTAGFFGGGGERFWFASPDQVGSETVNPSQPQSAIK